MYGAADFLGGLAARRVRAVTVAAAAVLLLYRALAVVPMSVLSPLTAVFAAVTPVAVRCSGPGSCSPSSPRSGWRWRSGG
ncbi:hypothetical protein NS359_01330 [Curtobacterium oceanosedimentum]|uniref:Uncharacterized protein n=1 Tax=Curtobacterium oceanosedimentum TaxID=465820 RepID=A0A147DUB8_9MICO|nr:hypothetical protein NS359_01330 [Curtobacterium oceanosedimentum]